MLFLTWEMLINFCEPLGLNLGSAASIVVDVFSSLYRGNSKAVTGEMKVVPKKKKKKSKFPKHGSGILGGPETLGRGSQSQSNF